MDDAEVIRFAYLENAVLRDVLPDSFVIEKGGKLEQLYLHSDSPQRMWLSTNTKEDAKFMDDHVGFDEFIDREIKYVSAVPANRLDEEAGYAKAVFLGIDAKDIIYNIVLHNKSDYVAVGKFPSNKHLVRMTRAVLDIDPIDWGDKEIEILTFAQRYQWPILILEYGVVREELPEIYEKMRSGLEGLPRFNEFFG